MHAKLKESKVAKKIGLRTILMPVMAKSALPIIMVLGSFHRMYVVATIVCLCKQLLNPRQIQ